MKKESNIKVDFITFYKFCVTDKEMYLKNFDFIENTDMKGLNI